MTFTRTAKRSLARRVIASAFATLKGLPALAVVLGVLLGIILTVKTIWQSDVPGIIRNASIAIVADRLAGDSIPIEVPHSTSEDQIFQIYNTLTNAPLLGEWVYEIVPFFSMENVSQGIYPQLVVLAPMVAERSFVVAGNTSCEEGRVNINDRFLDDQAELLTTLTHEIIHDQLGYFCTVPENYTGNRSVWVESHTTTATVEVLAGMCRYGNPIACQSFWQNISTLARRSVQAKLGRAHLLWLYNLWAGVVLRDHQEDISAEKMARFWSTSPSNELQGIVERYGELPWDFMVSPGICGDVLNTGVVEWGPDGKGRVRGMPFDDSRAMFGPIGTLLFCATR